MLIFPCLAEGQSIGTESQIKASDTVSLGFERVLNTFIWNGNVGIAVADSNNSLILHQTLRSKLIRSDPVANQGEYDGYVGYRGRIAEGWDMLARTTSLVVSDNQSIDLARLAQHQGLLGIGYKSDLWMVGVLGGYEVEVSACHLAAKRNGNGLQGCRHDKALHSSPKRLMIAGLRPGWPVCLSSLRSP